MIALFSLALIPVVFLLVYIYRKDMERPEPWPCLLKALGFGVLSCFVTLLVTLPLPIIADGSFFGAIYSAFFTAAIPEEGAKMLMLWLLIRKMKEFDEPFDGIVYAVCIGMGFAGFENILYLLEDEDFISLGIMRGLTAVPGHFSFAVIMGYFFAAAYFGSAASRTRNLLLAYVVPVVVHGLYDFMLMYEPDELIKLFIMLVWFVFCIVIYIVAYKFIKRMNTPALPPGAVPPPIDQQSVTPPYYDENNNQPNQY